MKLSTEFSEGKTDENGDEDFDSADIKEVNHLLRCFTIYSSILFRTVPPGVQSPLIAALLAYIDRFFGYAIVYTLDSVKEFHQVYHNTRIHTGVTDPAGWARWEQALVNRHLRAKEQIPATRRPAKEAMAQVPGTASYASLPSRPWGGSLSSSYHGTQACILRSQGRNCPQYCDYQHICFNCRGDHPSVSCPTRPNLASQTPWVNAPPTTGYAPTM